MKRPDFDVVYQAVKDKLFTLNDAKDWMALPFIHIPEPNEDVISDYEEYVSEQRKSGDLLDWVRSLETEKFYFQCFVCHWGDTFFLVGIEEDGRTFRFVALHNVRNRYPFGLMKYGIRLAPTVDDPRNVQFLCDPEINAWLDKGTGRESNFLHVSLSILGRMALMRDYNNQKDRYAVLVSEEKKPKIRGIATPREQLRQVQGPKMIYLDALPSAKSLTMEGETGREQRPHQRRGTWVTLRAERFRYHPKFQVEKGVYRKPTWVGDREAIVDGNIYTILD